MRCPLRRKEREDPPLIVHIKNNEEVRSYPFEGGTGPLFLSHGRSISKAEAECLCGANDVASKKTSQFAVYFLVLHHK